MYSVCCGLVLVPDITDDPHPQVLESVEPYPELLKALSVRILAKFFVCSTRLKDLILLTQSSHRDPNSAPRFLSDDTYGVAD